VPRRRKKTTGPPDFVGVGAQRAGTTWWFRLLSQHPGIKAPRGRRKELHFFDRFCAHEMRQADVEAYHDLFARRRGQIAGEWTPRYMGDVCTPRLLHRAAPEAKLLVLLRDPVERFRSGMLHQLTRAPERASAMVAAEAIERGRYALQLERLRGFWEPERILVLQYEKCRADPLGQYLRTLRFLGVDDGVEPPDFSEAKGTTMAPHKVEMWPDMRDALQATLEPEIERLRELVPGIELGLWPHFAHLDATAAR
jgi:hypothetical protein